MTVFITLTTAGADTGPFNLYSDVDGYISAFETNVDKADLLAGYSSSLVPNGTTIIRIMSVSTLCTNYVDVTLTTTTTTSTTTLISDAWSVKYSNILAGICAETPVTVYTALGSGITTGVTVYTDAGLTNELFGYDYISEVVDGTIYNINDISGVIGTTTGNSC